MVFSRYKGLDWDVFTMGMEGIDTHFSIHHIVTLFDSLLFIDSSLGVLLVDAVSKDCHSRVMAMSYMVEVST